MDQLKRLGLRPELVEAAAVANVGYAFAQESVASELEGEVRGIDRTKDQPGSENRRRLVRDQIEERLYLAASGYLFGASYYSLLNPGIARIVFWTAAHVYDRLRMPYAAVMAICAADDSVVSHRWREFVETPHRTANSSEAVARLLSAGLMLTENREAYSQQAFRIIEEGSRFPGLLVGNALIPIRLYHDLVLGIADTNRLGKAQSRTIAESTLRFMDRAAETIETAQADRFHWQRLQTSVLPVEPEFLATSMVVARSVKKLDTSLTGLMEGHEMHPAARVLMESAEDMLEWSPNQLSEEDYGLIERAEVLAQLRKRML